MSKVVYYEHPLNERIRTLLRLELLFRQAGHFAKGSTTWDSRMLIDTLLDLGAVFERKDLKTEIIKELERHQSSLSALSSHDGVDQDQLGTILRWLERLLAVFRAKDGHLGSQLKSDELLTVVRQRSSIPGGTCAFDLPAYQHWLSRPAEQRVQQHERWLSSLESPRKAVELLLKLIRGSAEPSHEIASGGMYQRILEANAPYQLIRVSLAGDSPYYPEISGGKHRFTVRFLHSDPQLRSAPVEEELPFRLFCCQL